MPAASLIPKSKVLRLTYVLVGPKIYSVVDEQVLVILGYLSVRGEGSETVTHCLHYLYRPLLSSYNSTGCQEPFSPHLFFPLLGNEMALRCLG